MLITSICLAAARVGYEARNRQGAGSCCASARREGRRGRSEAEVDGRSARRRRVLGDVGSVGDVHPNWKVSFVFGFVFTTSQTALTAAIGDRDFRDRHVTVVRSVVGCGDRREEAGHAGVAVAEWFHR